MSHCYQSLVPLLDNNKGKQDIQSLLFQLVVSVACHQFLPKSIVCSVVSVLLGVKLSCFLFCFFLECSIIFSPLVLNLPPESDKAQIALNKS